MRGFFQNFLQVIALLFRELFIFDTQLVTHSITEYIKKVTGNTQCPFCCFITQNDRKGYAKALGKPVLLIGICLLFSGVLAVILPKDYVISIAVIFIAVISGIWMYKIQKIFS